MNYLIAVDCEGIGGVLGEPFLSLTESADYALATENAVHEVNAAINGLFDGGADRVFVWDNHGKGKNLDFSMIDSRAEKVTQQGLEYRMDFLYGLEVFGVLFIGYHSREGTRGGILAHTYNSKSIQYVKVNGVPVGEVEIESWIAADHGVTPMLLSSDKACVDQITEANIHGMTFVTTKTGTGRNSGTLRPAEDILAEIYAAALKCSKIKSPDLFVLDTPASVEIRYTRSELAEKIYARYAPDGAYSVKYGADSHTLCFVVSRAAEIIKLMR